VQAIQKIKQIVGDWDGARRRVDAVFREPLKRSESKVTYPLSKLVPAEEELAKNPVALEWLEKRGITLQTAQKFHIGYVQSAKAVVPEHPWLEDGWILFPTFDGTANDKIIMLKYRSVRGKKHEPTGTPGFLRKSNMETALYNAQAISPFDDLFVVEGEPDCMIMDQAGYCCVALPSASFSPTPAMRDAMRQAKRIYLAGDSDPTGQQAMCKLWTELRGNTFLLKWPEGCKDANETFLKACAGNIDRFHALVEQLKNDAHQQPMQHVYDLRESLLRGNHVTPMSNPARLHFPWQKIDNWTAILPGDVMALFASESGMGKTNWLMGVLLCAVCRLCDHFCERLRPFSLI